MPNSTLELHRAPRGAQRALEATAAALKATALTLGREIWEFLKAVSSSRNVRKDMLECAARLAATQPGLARRLRRAAYGGWSY